MPSFCTYCGKSFTRKEHLERHLPSRTLTSSSLTVPVAEISPDTNIKPYVCRSCLLSFARKDLLQRHTMTYHELRDNKEPLLGGTPTVSGRTPIACQNCANAKTGCDKRVPCARCADKELPCAARYARRSSKASIRAAQAMAAFCRQLDEAGQHKNLVQPHDTQDYRSSPTPITGDIYAPGSNKPFDSSPLVANTSTLPEYLDESPQCGKPTDIWTSRAENPIHWDNPSFQRHDVFNPNLPTNQGQEWPNYPLATTVFSNNLNFGPSDFALRSDIPQSDPPNTPALLCSPSADSSHTPGTSILDFNEHVLLPANQRFCLRSTSIPEFDTPANEESSWAVTREDSLAVSAGNVRPMLAHLEYLTRNSAQSTLEMQLKVHMQHHDWPHLTSVSITQVNNVTRSVIESKTQKLLQEVWSFYRVRPKASADVQAPFLPSTNLLEHFLCKSLSSLSYYLALGFADHVDPNDMVAEGRSSFVLLLLMIAQGAGAASMAEAQFLSRGLAATCHVSLLKILDMADIPCDLSALRSVLLSTLIGLWSGDPWMMRTALCRKAMYMVMLKEANMFASPPPLIRNTDMTDLNNTTSLWRSWVKREKEIRSTYAWILVDFEASLFHDSSPALVASDLQVPLPGSEAMWTAETATDWVNSMQREIGGQQVSGPSQVNSFITTRSLNELYCSFEHGALHLDERGMCAEELRLLLYPLHSLIFHRRQLLPLSASVIWPGDSSASRLGSNDQPFEDAKVVLRRWHELAQDLHKLNPDCLLIRTSLILYHFICLNSVTSFPSMERLALEKRLDNPPPASPATLWGDTTPSDTIVHHCGQVFRMMALIPVDRRPVWWTMAIYRATLILSVACLARPYIAQQRTSCSSMWPASLGNNQSLSPLAEQSHSTVLGINDVNLENTHLNNTVALPRIGGRPGELVYPQSTAEILNYGMQVVDEGVGTGMGNAIKSKLVALSENWSHRGLYEAALGSYS